MIQVVNGEIKQYRLPTTGTLSAGESVSGYHLLDAETLRQEGWLPLEDIQPEYDIGTQYLINDGYDILENKVVVKYKVEDIPIVEDTDPEPDEPTELEALTVHVLEVDFRVLMIEMGL